MSSLTHALFCTCTLEKNSYARDDAADPEAGSALPYE